MSLLKKPWFRSKALSLNNAFFPTKATNVKNFFFPKKVLEEKKLRLLEQIAKTKDGRRRPKRKIEKFI
jgi:hypothetical protein